MRALRPFLLAAAVLALDQGLKAWADRASAIGESRPLLGDVVRLTRVHNPGGAFGIFPEHPEAFIAVSAAVVVGLAAILLLGRWRGMSRVGCAVLLAGGAGNLIDRVRWGYVLDFFDISGYPVFNLADAAIVVGAGLVALSLLVGRTR